MYNLQIFNRYSHFEKLIFPPGSPCLFYVLNFEALMDIFEFFIDMSSIFNYTTHSERQPKYCRIITIVKDSKSLVVNFSHLIYSYEGHQSWTHIAGRYLV